MSRLTTGSAPTVGGNTEAKLSDTVLELRVSLGGIPEVANAYGTPEDFPYDAADLEGESEFDSPAPSSDGDSLGLTQDAYSFSTGDVQKQPTETSHTDAPSSDESEESESEQYQNDLNLSLKGHLQTPPDATEDEAQEHEDTQVSPYAENVNLSSQPEPQFASVSPPTPSTHTISNYEKIKKETDHHLAKLASFLPDKVRAGLDKKFDEAVNLARPNTEEGYRAATEALTKLQNSLDDKAPELRTTENKFLRKQVQATLNRDGNTLEPDAKQSFVDRFSALDKDLPTEEGEAKSQLESLQNLSNEINYAIQDRLKAISDLCVDFERLTPIVNRALSIEGDKQQELKQANEDIKAGFGGQFVKEGLSVEAIQDRIAGLDGLIREVFKSFTLDDAKEEQKRNLPASPDSLEPFAIAIGSGAFGEVFDLDSDTGANLVGKSFPANNADAKKEMEHEEEIYARIGEHPNIAKCYGIHEVDGKSMLVMDKIEGNNAEKVLNDLNERYRKKKISREEYLAATQHIIKGTLMGLAHMEALGLVHKDIKGDNIKFDTRTNQAVLIDMGLAQPEGKSIIPKAFTPIAPPERFAAQKGDEFVTTFWDSFTVGKMLFEEMERDEEGNRHVLTPGLAQPMKKKLFTKDELDLIGAGAKSVVKRTDSGEFEARTSADGRIVGQALKKADSPIEANMPGNFGASTQYVDFMNRLTHPDPKQRLSPSEALKHPFMTDTFMSGEELDKVFGVATSRQQASEEEDSDEENKGLRADTDALADAYSKGEKKNFDDVWEEESKEESEEAESEKKDTAKQPETEIQTETPKPTPPPQQPQPVKAQSKAEIEAALTKGTTALQRWEIAKQQVERQFNAAYASLGGDKAKLKAAGFTKGKKFSDYFTYNKGLEKLVKSLEEAKKKKSKDVPKLAGKVTDATAHYRDKISRKADEDFGWAKATPAVEPAFWKTLVAALDDVDKWVKS